MQPWSGVPDLPARIAEVRAVGAAFDELQLQLVSLTARASDVVADTRWRSKAMDAYEREAEAWRGAVAQLAADARAAREGVSRVVNEMVIAELLRSTVPGMTVAR